MGTLRILAELSFYTKDIIGHDRTYYNKYKPMFKIRDDMYNGGQIEFVDKTVAYSGDKGVKAYIIFAFDNFVSEYLKEGTNFSFGEGPKVLGEGRVLNIL